MSMSEREREGGNLCVTHLSPKSKQIKSLYMYRGVKYTGSDPLSDSTTKATAAFEPASLYVACWTCSSLDKEVGIHKASETLAAQHRG